MKFKLLTTIALVVATASIDAAAQVTSVTDGNYTAGTTWSDGNPPSAGNDYIVQHLVERSGDGAVSLLGDSVTVDPSGHLRLTAVDSSTDTFTINDLSLNGGLLQFRSSNQYARTINLANAFTVDAGSEIRIGDGGEQFDMRINLDGGFSGSNNLTFIGNGGNDIGDNQELRGTVANSLFSGDWDVDSIDSGVALLRADAANALGTGSVALNTRSQLVNNATGGLDSLVEVLLNEASSTLTLTEAWNNDVATLTLNDGTLDLADSMSQIGIFSIAGNNLAPGTYSAGDLTALGFGGTFLGTGTITVTPEPSAIAIWSLLGLGLIGFGVHRARRQRRC